MLTAGGLGREEIERLLDAAEGYRAGRGPSYPGALVALAFFEDSLRTQVGYQAAAARLGARTVMLSAPKHEAQMGAPETVSDALRSVASWFDVLCLRHPDEQSVHAAARETGVAVVNCGNGRDEHPTQAVADLLCIRDLRGSIDRLRLALVGDLHAMRTAHSLALAVAPFEDVSVRAIAPAGLGLPERYARPLIDRGHAFEETTVLELRDIDIVYVAGLPAPTRIGTLSGAQQAAYRITMEVVEALDPGAHVLCPLPRVDEIEHEVDSSPRAAYFRQSANALWARMAVLDAALRPASLAVDGRREHRPQP